MSTLSRMVKYVKSPTLFVVGNLTIFGILASRKTSSLDDQLRSKRLVVITGCDSGLGLSMAYWSSQLGYKVLAGCLDPTGEGADFLKKSNCSVVGVDVTKSDSLENFKCECQNILGTGEAGNRIELGALIPNAAIGAFGEYFWQTERQCQEIMDVNFWGSVNLTKSFKSLLLRDKSRLIVISSDCADYPLPGMGIYSASKAALETWATSLRREVGKYGVSVISFQPGSFPMTSRLFARQQSHYDEMKNHMSTEELEFYGKYFHNYNDYVIKLFAKSPAQIGLQDDKTLMKHFIWLLEGDIQGTQVLVYESASVKLFHFLVRNCPTKLSDILVSKSLKFPVWNSTPSN